MKFLVLCVYELRESSESERRAASRVLEAAGFHHAGFEDSRDDPDAGLQAVFVGEFRAPSAAVLRDRVHEDLGVRLLSHGLRSSVSLCIRPSPFADDGARMDLAV